MALALLGAGADITVKDVNDMTPLHMAASGSNRPVVSALLKLGADPNARDADGRTPLDFAEARGDSGMADEIREAQACKRAGLDRA